LEGIEKSIEVVSKTVVAENIGAKIEEGFREDPAMLDKESLAAVEVFDCSRGRSCGIYMFDWVGCAGCQ
jgi:hypothetical protein